jgi:hypothetical protein
MADSRPKRLYKYMAPSRIDVLESGLIAYTPPGRFNDPFDFNPAVNSDFSEEYLDEQCARFEQELPPEKHVPRAVFKAHMRGNKAALDARLSRELHEMFNNTYGVLSCSELESEPLMWSHYAQQHEGFVLELDLTHEFFRQRMRPVTYSETRPIHSRPDDVADAVFVKADIWHYEKEWRSIELLSRCNRLTIEVAAAPKMIYRHPYPKDAITRVVCGCRMAPEVKIRIRSNLRKWGFFRCDLEELSIDRLQYGFARNKLLTDSEQISCGTR